MREERKAKAAEELAKYKAAMKALSVDGEDSDSSDGEDDGNANGEYPSSDEEDSFSDWEGFEDKSENGILKKRQKYENDDGETTLVTIEDISEPHADLSVDLSRSQEVLEQSIQRAQDYAKMLGADRPAKPKKKKFRYLTKSERKVNNAKARGRSRRK